MLRAGFGKVELSASIEGAPMRGYANRDGGVRGVHDPLYARALVLEHGDRRVALCALDLCGAQEDVVAAARARVADVAPADLFVAASHTHSGPADDAGCWPDGLEGRIAAAVAHACTRLRPAALGAGWGALQGHALNRRRLEDPVDPAVLAIRLDADDGAPLGVVFGYACHPVVLGPDNRQASADWPGVSARVLEERLGPDAVAVFLPGACADVNPLTEGVRDGIAGAARVVGQLEDVAYPAAIRTPGRRSTSATGSAGRSRRRSGWAVPSRTRCCGCTAARRPPRSTGCGPSGSRFRIRPRTARAAFPLGDHFLPRAPVDAPLEVMLVGIDGPGSCSPASRARSSPAPAPGCAATCARRAWTIRTSSVRERLARLPRAGRRLRRRRLRGRLGARGRARGDAAGRDPGARAGGGRRARPPAAVGVGASDVRRRHPSPPDPAPSRCLSAPSSSSTR